MIFLLLSVADIQKNKETSYTQVSEFSYTLLAQLYQQETHESQLPPIQRTAQGKPYFLKSPWHFSISHSGEKVVVALALEPVGVDIQQWRCPSPSLIQRVCSEHEKEWLSQQHTYNSQITSPLFSDTPSTTHATRTSNTTSAPSFSLLWVGKEAIAKFLGCGIGSGRTLPSLSVVPEQELSPVFAQVPTPDSLTHTWTTVDRIPPTPLSSFLSLMNHDITPTENQPSLPSQNCFDHPQEEIPLQLVRWQIPSYSLALCYKSNKSPPELHFFP